MADAFEKVGKDGVITVEEGKTSETTLEFVEGMQFDKGYISPYFRYGNPEMKWEQENVLILLLEKKLANVREMLPLLDKVAKARRPLLIIAEDVESEALAVLVVNRLKSLIEVCAVKSPGFGDRRKAMMEDIAVLTGGTFISEDRGIKLENVTLDMLGTADQVVVDKENTTIICDKSWTRSARRRSRPACRRSARRWTRPRASTTRRSSPSGWRSWSAASRSSRSGRRPRPR